MLKVIEINYNTNITNYLASIFSHFGTMIIKHNSELAQNSQNYTK